MQCFHLVLKPVAKKVRESCDEVPKEIHYHMIRKTKVMDLNKKGASLPFIMPLLGHESMSTTS